MEPMKPILKITTEQWDAKRVSGLAAVINDRPYIVTTHESTNEPMYQPVVILEPKSSL